MRTKNEQIVPIAFWLGFLALGLATGLAGPANKHASHQSAVAKTHAAAAPVVATTASAEKASIRTGDLVARD